MKCPHCSAPIRICEECGREVATIITTDHLYLCSGCAQDSHCPCDLCGLVVPGHEVDGTGSCIDCREKEANMLAEHGNTPKVRRKADRWLVLLAAERLALTLLENGTRTAAGVDVEDLLSRVRANEPKFS